MRNSQHPSHRVLWALRVVLALACMGVLVASGDPLAVVLGTVLGGLLLYQFLFRDDQPPSNRY